MSFGEVRDLDQIQKLKVYGKEFGVSKMTTKFIEGWINDTLKECINLEIPGALTKPEHKLPLSRFDLDRISLTVRIDLLINKEYEDDK